jgi:DNA helicase II / ATP-dependent DNA helicase PcrA
VDFLTGLNDAQKEAVLHRNGPLLVIAGAGSGKTRVLTHRIAALLESGIPAREILAVTFTNKAANEMGKRVQKLIQGQNQSPLIGTFHSIGVRILRREIGILGRDLQFSIYDDTDMKGVARELLKSRNIDAQTMTPKALLSVISGFKNKIINPEQARSTAGNYREQLFAELFSDYEKSLYKSNAVDFDDLLLLPVKILQSSPEVLRKYQYFWQYLLIDEYQDTNILQYLFSKLVTEKHRNICAIGDADQSIYSFRGADLSNILSFQKEYPDAKLVRLEKNYRSTKTILAAADSVIKNNRSRIPKQMTTDNLEGDAICVHEFLDEREESEMIFREIRRLLNKGKKPSDMAILYRTNAQSRSLEEAGLRHAIPYTIVGGVRFYARTEVKDILAYLRIIMNIEDTVSLDRIINVPSRKIGNTSLQKLKSFAQDRGVSLGKILFHIDAAEGLTPGVKNAIRTFLFVLEKLRKNMDQMKLSDFISSVIEETAYDRYLLQDGEMGEIRLENVRELISVAQKYDEQRQANDSLPLFLEEVALVSDLDSMDEKNDRLTLMTLHSAKGLEFPIVFIPGCEENLFPNSRALFSPDDLEEERRLMYVGITRARENLFLSSVKTRLLYGDFMTNPPSRFLEEIPQDICEGTYFLGRESTWSNSEEKEEVFSFSFSVGDVVEHKIFGLGRIEKQEGDIFTVAFQNGQTKRLAASIAPITKVDEEFL